MDYIKLHKKIFDQIKKVGSEIDNLWYQTGNYYSNTYELKDSKDQKKHDDLCVYFHRLMMVEDKVLKKSRQSIENIKVVNLSEFEPSNDIGGWKIPK